MGEPAKPIASPAAAPAKPPKPHHAGPTDAVTGVMIKLPGGSFTMGSPDADAEEEKKVHDVTIAPFEMDQNEVTVAAWKACESAGACRGDRSAVSFDGVSPEWAKSAAHCNGARSDRDDHPINCVDWHDATTFCKWAGKRLPTEAEWEYAARAIQGGGADNRPFPWGVPPPNESFVNACGKECVELLTREKLLPKGVSATALYDANDGFPTTSPVGKFFRGESELKLNDMAGNVQEWTADSYAPYAGSKGAPPAKELKVTRGGSWNTWDRKYLRATRRGKDEPSTRDSILGFRCARSEVARK
jgi:formylglycine-generating enzyme required for sulfatase activity